MAILKYFVIIIISSLLIFPYCSSDKLTSAEAQKIIQQHFPPESYTVKVIGVRKEENYYICKTEITFKQKTVKNKTLTNINLILFKYDTGWQVEQYQDSRGNWFPFSDYIERINSIIEYEEELPVSTKEIKKQLDVERP